MFNIKKKLKAIYFMVNSKIFQESKWLNADFFYTFIIYDKVNCFKPLENIKFLHTDRSQKLFLINLKSTSLKIVYISNSIT